METPKIVAVSGSFSRPSKTTVLVQHVVGLVRERYGFDSEIYDMIDVGPSLGNALWRRELDDAAQHVLQKIVDSDILVIGAPTYKGSYPGLFKHLIDLIDPHELKAKPILITATGGGDRHALMVEHQLRPLFGFFMAHTLPTAIYASERDFVDNAISSEQLRTRIDDAVGEVGAFFLRQRLIGSRLSRCSGIKVHDPIRTTQAPR
ncbi:FMN reductase [Rhizobium phaseoli]|uniref:FMN reductase n=1 Tax=Rhizobium phaseoli TaxID=396 RepID=UPI0014384000|nr:FMN reductase [Rhizobium phaseoli]MDK4725527.1 FMN reductase [Rhizobium phaseoli]NKE89263.1 FMN reductase [Rhizobium phaseoli]